MKVIAKCHNYAGCLQAYRGEEIELPAGAPLVCPECGKPLTIVKPPPPLILRYAPLLILLAAIAAGIYFGAPYVTRMLEKKAPQGAATPAPGGDPTGTTTPPQANGTDNPPSNEPPQTVVAPKQIDMNPTQEENQNVKAEVLKRIDLMPNVSQANKDKLYNSVERARSMGKLLTIPFGSGKIALGVAEAQALKTELDRPEIVKLREDPTAVFVVLGYADPKGDEKKNIAISQARADAVLEAMRDKAGVNNVMHSVAMGGSTIVDAKNLEKNRIVEIWAVLP